MLGGLLSIKIGVSNVIDYLPISFKYGKIIFSEFDWIIRIDIYYKQ